MTSKKQHPVQLRETTHKRVMELIAEFAAKFDRVVTANEVISMALAALDQKECSTK
ncbi:hypothetical protein [Pontibacter qinzhouensis]|uniref:hypothetical protein n=1 Tax=Pontibacter qinzhouensis TaxID=2603253 RepID=UPI0016506623|nr:hypothetical protein [Pontibacter qinzhouensis]